MIGYVMVGTNDLEKSAAFYDVIFEAIDIKRTFEFPTSISWGTTMDQPAFSVTKPFDEQPATVGNGVMVALVMDDIAKVDKIYNKAIEMGATCEGGPRHRGDSPFYAAYFRDLDGNKLNAFCMDPNVKGTFGQ